MENTILIVDDSPYIVDGLVALLKRKGFIPVATHGGEEALTILKTTKPDLILLDIMMEPMDGWETLDRIKADPATRDLPILMFSAKKITPEEAQEHRLNIDDFVSKPVNPSQLLEAINRIFTRRKDLSLETGAAKASGIETALVDEYASLRKSIDVDRNLLVALKNANTMGNASQEVRNDNIASIKKLEDKIAVDEKRLAELHEKIPRIS